MDIKFSTLILALLAALVTTAAPITGAGSVAGRVRFTGQVPPPRKVFTTDGRTLLQSDLEVDVKSKGLKSVIVTIEDAAAQPKLKKAPAALIDQRDMIFLPRVVAVQHGQAVRFENNDLCNHGVMAISKLPANQFNLFVTSSQPYEHVFEPQKNPIPIGCALHPWMRAWVHVASHPWFAVTDKDGKFNIDRVPAGKHTLHFRHPDTGLRLQKTVEVPAGKTAMVDAEWRKLDAEPAPKAGSR